MLVATGFSRLIPWLLKLAIDRLKTEPASGLGPLVLAMIAAALLSGLFLYLQRWFIASSSRRIECHLRKKLFSHVQRLDLSFFAQNRVGDLMARFTNDIGSVGMVAGPGIIFSVSLTVTIGMSLALMIAISPFLTLVSIAPYPVITLITFWFGKRMYARSRRVQDLFGLLSSRVQEDISGVRVVRAYNQEGNAAANFGRLSRDYLSANMEATRLRGRFMSAMGLLAGCGQLIGLLLGGALVMEQAITLGSFVAFNAYLLELTWPVIGMGWVISMIQQGASAAERLNEVLAASPAIRSGPVTGRPAPAVCFESVTFRYPGASENALEAISFRIEPGQTLGIVGRTGSGKSTVMKLVQRLYDPTGGVIRLGGVDLKERDLDPVRAMAGYAPQDGFLFSRTVRENIAYGRSDATLPEIEAAADQARLGADIAGFSGRLDTVVGERGITLSGGQRQRLSLARALVTEPDLLLLDDTLSSVDAETEQAILSNLRRYLQGRTAIIASHRISSVERADRILVLDRGRVVEEGGHRELIAKQGLYAQLFERQRLAREIEEAR